MRNPHQARGSTGWEFGTAQAAQAAGDQCSILSGLESPSHNVTILARAFPCRCAPGDNLALHNAIRTAPKRAVIACDAGGRVDVGYFGELMALDAKNRGLAGLIINGAVRDSAALDRIGFPVYCSGYAPAQSRKRNPGAVGRPIRFRGIRITEGDYVVADRDAIVIISQDAWHGVRKRITAVCINEEKIRTRLAAGEHLFDILF